MYGGCDGTVVFYLVKIVKLHCNLSQFVVDCEINYWVFGLLAFCTLSAWTLKGFNMLLSCRFADSFEVLPIMYMYR